MSTARSRALDALRKRAPLGPDLTLKHYSRRATRWNPCLLTELPPEVLRQATNVGIQPADRQRSGTYFQIDHSVVLHQLEEAYAGSAEVMSTAEALTKYEWAKDYWWRLIDVGTDKYTALAELKWDKGYFVRVHEGQKVVLPLQSCLFISRDNLDQNVHNIILLEPDSEAQIITGCVVHPNVHRGLHIGISEFYVKKGAKLTFTMIHNWSQNFDVRPRTAALIEDDATFVNNYVCLQPVKSLQMYPTAYLRGRNSRARFNAILLGRGASYLDLGSRLILEGDGSRGEVINRAIATDTSQIYARGQLVGANSDSKAHLECRGLLVSEQAAIYAIPELAGKAKGSELTHEAAVGKIAKEQVEYLMARGLDRSEAEALIVRGFMDVSILGLPEGLEAEIRRMIDVTAQAVM